MTGNGTNTRRLAGRRAMVAAMALAAAVVAGCGGTHSSTSSSAAAASPTTASTSAAAPAQSSGTALTAPGTTLKPGQSAIVDYTETLANGSDGPSYKLKVTIASITPGSMSDLSGISWLIPPPAGTSPTYVKVQMTNLSNSAIATGNGNDPGASVEAIESNGNADSSVGLDSYFPKCPDTRTPNPFGPGQTFTTCYIYMEHGEATRIGYEGSDATDVSPITWAAG